MQFIKKSLFQFRDRTYLIK